MKNFVKNHKKLSYLVVGIVILVLVIVFRSERTEGGDEVVSSSSQKKTEVSLVNLNMFFEETPLVKTTGEVEALEQVELKSEVAARVVAVPVELGQEVVAGERLVVFDGAGMSSQFRQAEAAYERAQAQLSQLEAQYTAQEAQHAQTITAVENSVTAARAALESAQNNLKKNENEQSSEIVQDAYANARLALVTVQNAITAVLIDADIMLGEDNEMANDAFENELARFNPTTLTRARDAYIKSKTLQHVFDEQLQTITVNSSNENVDAALTQGIVTLEQMQGLVDALSVVLDNTRPIGSMTPTQYTALRATVQKNKDVVATQRSVLTIQQQAISAAKTGLTSAEIVYQKALEDMKSASAQSTARIAASEAQLEQAWSAVLSQRAEIKRSQASIDGIGAELAKTVVRSPISGTVASLPIKKGELASPGVPVASVVNSKSLQVTTFIDSKERGFVNVGTRARVDGVYEGAVVRIAPSLDKQTNKVETVIALTAAHTQLVVGEYVDVEIFSSQEVMVDGVLVPLSAVQIDAKEKNVYVVADDQTAHAIPVEVNRIIGETVEVTSGLEGVIEIISSVRGIEEGEQLSVVPGV